MFNSLIYIISYIIGRYILKWGVSEVEPLLGLGSGPTILIEWK